MRRIVLGLIALLVRPLPSFAMGVIFSVDDLVPQSDLIVVGKLTNVSEYSSDGMDYGLGRIVVSEVIWGTAAPGDWLDLRWQNETGLVCPRIEHSSAISQEGIWLLTRSPDGTVRADDWGRFVALDQRTEVERAIARHPICVRSANYHDATAAPYVTVVFRNSGARAREFPGIEFRDRTLLIGPGIDIRLISLKDPNRAPVAWYPNGVRVTNDLSPVVVAPRGERRIEVDLSALTKIDPDAAYDLSLKTRASANPEHATIFARDRSSDVAQTSTSKPLGCGTLNGANRSWSTTPWVFPLYEGILVASIAFAIGVHRGRRRGLPTETVLRRAAFQGLVVGTGGIAVMLLAEVLIWTSY